MNGRAAARRLLIAALPAAVLTATAACAAPTGTAEGADTGAPPTIRLTITTPGQPTTSRTTGTTLSSTSGASVVAADPDAAVEELAVTWLIAYRTASFTDAADAWIDRTAPYVTDELRQRNDQLRRDSRGPGVAWQDFVYRGCTARVLGAAAVIPPEAPRTDNTMHVQAAGTLRTTCASGAEPPDEALAVTLTAARTDAAWRIASRDY